MYHLSTEGIYITYYFITVGSVDATRVLLEAGARVNAENSLGRTAAQLGAFIGKNNNNLLFKLKQ